MSTLRTYPAPPSVHPDVSITNMINPQALYSFHDLSHPYLWRHPRDRAHSKFILHAMLCVRNEPVLIPVYTGTRFPRRRAQITKLHTAPACYMEASNAQLDQRATPGARLPPRLACDLVQGDLRDVLRTLFVAVRGLLAAAACFRLAGRTRDAAGCEGLRRTKEGRAGRFNAVYSVLGRNTELGVFFLEAFPKRGGE